MIETTKTVPTKTVPTKSCSTNFKFQQNTVHFLLITIALLTAVSIYCYMIKYKTKQKRLLPYYVTNDKLKQVLYKCVMNMESNDELKKTDIKNQTCYYFNGMIKIEDFDFDHIL